MSCGSISGISGSLVGLLIPRGCWCILTDLTCVFSEHSTKKSKRQKKKSKKKRHKSVSLLTWGKLSVRFVLEKGSKKNCIFFFRTVQKVNQKRIKKKTREKKIKKASN